MTDTLSARATEAAARLESGEFVHGLPNLLRELGQQRPCRCGPDGCADSACPGRAPAVQHLPADDTEGGAL
jgi:hypothetical protein